jgi:hypothetical protein
MFKKKSFKKSQLSVLVGALYAVSNIFNAAEAPSYDIKVTLPIIEKGQYHRPYIAIWVEDEKRVSQRSVVVWMQKAKWLPDLKRYWRRVARKHKDIVDGVTSATKKPGSHTIKWDGLNDKSQPLIPGKYSICVEAAREKGGREAICTKIDYGKTASADVVGKYEITHLSVKLN